MFSLSMPSHIQEKYRIKYYYRYKIYLTQFNISYSKFSDFIHRKNYYNAHHRYYNSLSLIVKGKSIKNFSNTIDLSSSSVFIKSPKSITDSSTQSSISSLSTYNCFKPDDKDIINTFNVLDLLLPSYPQTRTVSEKKEPIMGLEYTEDEKKLEYELLKEKIENIQDLINLGTKYKNESYYRKKRFNINLRVLAEMVEPLKDLDNMIGMTNIKSSIFNKIILFLQGLDNKNKDFQHIVLCGGPGMGKTEVAKIIGKIYSKMGILSKGDFKEVKLTDLKAGYVGQSEIKTQKILDESKGCVLFIDEAYSIGSNDKIDSYSQGILDLINPYLDKNKNDFILIIAGYKEDLNNRFFRGNQGLKSRFGLWLEIDEYSSKDLCNIFVKKIRDYEWKIDNKEVSSDFFDKHKNSFKNYGRDIENFFSKCKLAHAKRVLFSHPDTKKHITEEDILNGYEIYKNEVNIDNKKQSNKLIEFMYT